MASSPPSSKLETLQWLLLAVYIVGFLFYTSRPAQFLVSGSLSPIRATGDDNVFVILNYIDISLQVFMIYLILLYFTYQIGSKFGKFLMHAVFLGLLIPISLTLLIVVLIDLSQCNSPLYPYNQCNGPLYCCYNAVPECSSVSYLDSYCTSVLALTNPNVVAPEPNKVFIEYTIWRGVLLLFHILFYVIQIKLLNKRKIIKANNSGRFGVSHVAQRELDSKYPNIGSHYTTTASANSIPTPLNNETNHLLLLEMTSPMYNLKQICNDIVNHFNTNSKKWGKMLNKKLL